MSSEPRHDRAYVWVWLPGHTEPVVAGVLARARNVRDVFAFRYGQSYLARGDAISLYEPELPLQAGVLPLAPGFRMPSAIRDASPDAWGRRVIINRTLGLKGRAADGVELDELTYLLESGSDRAGAIDFQLSSTDYVPRQRQSASLEELMVAAEQVEKGVPLRPELDQALQHGTSLGGARPKVIIEENDCKYIAKFSASGDLYSVVKAEFIAMRLAAHAGLEVAPVKLARALGKDVLLVDRFDRVRTDGAWQRKGFVSALTLFELDEMQARYASYELLAEIIRHRFKDPKATLREVFSRMVFNVLVGNTDDHARNHAAFWDGRALAMTPAYDICPQARTGGEASQAMLINGNDRLSRLTTCLGAAGNFLLSVDEAKSIATGQIRTITDRWQEVCDEADLSEVDRALFWRRQFLNPFAFDEAPAEIAALVA